MLYYTMVCRQNRQDKKRPQASKETNFVASISDKKTWTVTGVFRKDV